MAIDVEKTKGIIDVIKEMTSKELAVTLFLMVGSVSLAFWVENRYAKIEETQAEIEITRKEIKKTEQEIERHKFEIIQMHVRSLELIKAQPKSVQETIDKNSNSFMENYKRLSGK